MGIRFPPGPSGPKTVIVGALLATSGIDEVPPSGWPLEAGLERLAAAGLDDRSFRRTLDRWERAPLAGHSRFPVRDVLRTLAADGHLRPTGIGSQAVLRVDPAWVVRCQAAVRRLSARDARTMAEAAQATDAMATISSKMRSAARPSGSGTIRSLNSRRHVVTR